VVTDKRAAIATVGADGMPHVMPVAVFYDPDADALVIGANVEFGEAVMTSSKKITGQAQQREDSAGSQTPESYLMEMHAAA